MTSGRFTQLAGPLLIAAVVLAPFRMAAAQTIAPSATRPAPSQLEGDPTYYYLRPFDVPGFILSWEKAGYPGRDGVLGFLAGVFTRDEGVLRAVMDLTIASETQGVLALAMMLAAKAPAARDAMQKWGLPPEQAARILRIKPLLQNKIDRPQQFDGLWGASFATADPVYVRPIYEYYEAVAAAPGIDVADIVAIIMMTRGPNSSGPESKTAMLAMGQKYGRDTFMRVTFAASALWSLESNARQHKFVAAALDALVKERAGTAAVGGLAELRAQRARR